MSVEADGAAFEAYRGTRFFGSLDGLRCLCILLVMWHHAPRGAFDLDARILSRGFTGVDFFFVLSGFLITTLLLREEARDGRFSLGGFYRRRVLRIVPVYYLVVTVMAVYWIGIRGLTQHLDVLPAYYLFLANFISDDIPLLTITWSLSAEEQYYLIWPLLLLLLPMALRWRGGVVAGLVVLSAALATGVLPFIAQAPADWQAPLYGLATSTQALLLGTLLGIVLNDRRGFAVLYRLAGHRLSALLTFGLLILAWQFLPGRMLGWPNVLMHGAMALMLASLVLREDNALAPVLRLKPIARVGAISYGIYLWHLVGRHVGVEAAKLSGLDGEAGAVIAMLAMFAASVLIAEISFRYYESWFLKLKLRGPRPRPAT